MAEHKMNGWISVDDRLPEMSSDYERWSDNVLCIDKHGNIVIAFYWKQHGGVWSDGEWFHIVTHWRPLPPPPEAK